MTIESVTHTCSDCGLELRDTIPDPTTGAYASCNGCGSNHRSIVMRASESVSLDIHDSVRLQAHQAGVSKKKGKLRDMFVGDDLRKSTGTWVHKVRDIDYENNSYHEEVVDKTTSVVLHHTSEPLSEHRGHGSAKAKKTSSNDVK